jgi:DNA-directed RNA polymerase specialized sigma24 family protein
MDPVESLRSGPTGGNRPPERPAWRALIDRCRIDDDSAWREFHGLFQAFAQRRLRHHFPTLAASDRADLVSAALERLVKSIRDGQIRGASDAEVGAYMSRTVRNQALDLLSRRRPEAPLDDGERTEGRRDDLGYQRVLVQKVTEIVGTWSSVERFLFVQKAQGVPSEAIKRELERSPFFEFIDAATVDTRFHRLRHRLRSQLEC